MESDQKWFSLYKIVSFMYHSGVTSQEHLHLDNYMYTQSQNFTSKKFSFTGNF